MSMGFWTSWVYLAIEELLKRFGIDPNDKDKVTKNIDSDVRIYDDFIRGNCVGYTMY